MVGHIMKSPILRYGHDDSYIIIMQGKFTLWQIESSPPARAVRVLIDILGLDFEYKEVDFMNMEHKSPEYLKNNPLGTIPTLRDGDFYLSDSHAMLLYLLSKYGGEHRERLYPSDLRTRALIDQAMFFDTGVYFIRAKNVALPTAYHGMKGVPDSIIPEIEDAYSVVEAFLKSGPYVAGEQFTIADISLGLTTAAMQPIHKLDKDKYPRVAAWYDRLQQIDPFKKNSEVTTRGLGAFLTAYWAKNNAQ